MAKRTTNTALAVMIGELRVEVDHIHQKVVSLEERSSENHDTLTSAATRLEVLVTAWEGQIQTDHDLLHTLATRFNVIYGTIGVLFLKIMGDTGFVQDLVRKLIG